METFDHSNNSSYQYVIKSNEFIVFLLSFLSFVIIPTFSYLVTFSNGGYIPRDTVFLFKILSISVPIVFLLSFFYFTNKFKNIGDYYFTKNIITKLCIVIVIDGFNFLLSSNVYMFYDEFTFTIITGLIIIGSIVFLSAANDFVKWLGIFSRNFISFDENLIKGFFYYALINCLTKVIFYGTQLLAVFTDDSYLFFMILDFIYFLNLIWLGASIGGGLSVFYILYQIKSLFQKKFVSQPTMSEIINDSYVSHQPTQQHRRISQTVVPTKQKSEYSLTNIKKELSDLKDMLDDGLITQEEYDTAREKIIKKLN